MQRDFLFQWDIFIKYAISDFDSEYGGSYYNLYVESYRNYNKDRFFKIETLAHHLDMKRDTNIGESRLSPKMLEFIWNHVYKDKDGPMASIDNYGKFSYKDKTYYYYFNTGGKSWIDIDFSVSPFRHS